MSWWQQDNNSQNNNGYETNNSNSFNDAVSSTYNSSYDENAHKSQIDTTSGSNDSFYSYKESTTAINSQSSWNNIVIGESQQSLQGQMSQNSWACTQSENQNWDNDMKASQTSDMSTYSSNENSILCQALNDWENKQITDSQLINNAYEWEQKQ